MIRPLILCVVLAGMAGAEELKVTDVMRVYPPNNTRVDCWNKDLEPIDCKTKKPFETTESRIEKLEKRVAALERGQRIGGKLKANPVPCQPGGVAACVDSQRISNDE